MGVPIAGTSAPNLTQTTPMPGNVGANANSSGPFPSPTSSQPNLPAAPPAPMSQPSLPAAMQPVAAPAQRLVVRLPQVGTRLISKRGEYEVRRILGTGEFGAVYDCLGPFDQVYAVKMIRPANRPYQEVYSEWAKENQRLMSLRHPNVVYMHDAFEQDHLFYMALEKCEHSLTDMIGAPMQEGLVIELARQLLAAVQFLHDNDIIHDDLHPGNVLIIHGVDRPTVKISDLGISHELRGAPAVRPNVVHHKIMAPEVVASGYTSKQSDLYQVGLLMYWMLTGQPAIPLGVPYQELDAHRGRRRAAKNGGVESTGRRSAGSSRRCASLSRRVSLFVGARSVGGSSPKLPTWQNRELFPVK